jgi:hypothetical protein
MHDLIVAVDIGVRDDIMRMVAGESPAEQDAYGHKVSTFLVFLLLLVLRSFFSSFSKSVGPMSWFYGA